MDHVELRTTVGRPLIQWRAVFGGVLLGLAAMVLLTSFWLALAFGQEMAVVQQNLDWYLAGSGIVVMLLGGFLAGWLSGIRGLASGIVNGSAVWAIALLATLSIGIPTAFTQMGQITGQAADPATFQIGADAAWTTFWAILIGLGSAMVGGLLGGMVPRHDIATTVEGTAHTEPERDRMQAERNRGEAERLTAESERLRQEAERKRRVS